MAVDLHYRILGEGQPLIILHGLFGSSDNWQTLAKSWSDDFKVFLVDQRNHGHSPHSEEFSYQLMADDLKALFEKEKIKNAILLGHSMGGKTAMLFAQQNVSLLAKLIIVDIGPQGYEPHHTAILAGLNSVDLSVQHSRKEVEAVLAPNIPELGVRQFLMKNLFWIEKGQLGWRINIPVLSRTIMDITGEIASNTVNVKTLFIRGGKSNYITDADFERIDNQFPQSEIVTIAKSGHWVHAETPAEFNEFIRGFV